MTREFYAQQHGTLLLSALLAKLLHLDPVFQVIRVKPWLEIRFFFFFF